MLTWKRIPQIIHGTETITMIKMIDRTKIDTIIRIERQHTVGDRLRHNATQIDSTVVLLRTIL